MEVVRQAVLTVFRGDLESVRAHGTGHIHDTFVVHWRPRPSAAAEALLVQRFNADVFTSPELVMNNLQRVSDHVQAKLRAAGISDAERRVLRVRRTPDGALCWRTDGLVFRAFELIADTVSFDVAKTARQPLEAGRAFGTFVAQLADLPAPPLAETIPAFHDTEARLAALRAAVASDPLARCSQLQGDLARVEARVELAGSLARLERAGALPRRTIHNDAKLSNLLFDARSEDAVCVIDLDTVMPGLVAYDFGDLVRTTGCLVAEDSTDLTTVDIRMDYIEALAEGYVAATAALMGEVERASLVLGPKLFCYELGMRFLTDHVLGDHYFPIDRPGHNLDRARVQLRLVEELERREDALRACIDRATR